MLHKKSGLSIVLFGSVAIQLPLRDLQIDDHCSSGYNQLCVCVYKLVYAYIGLGNNLKYTPVPLLAHGTPTSSTYTRIVN